MSTSQLIFAAVVSLGVLLASLVAWKTAVAQGYGLAASAPLGTGWQQGHGRRRHGGMLCGDADPNEAVGGLLRFAQTELNLDTMQQAALCDLEPALMAAIAKLRAAVCVNGPPDRAAPKRLAALAESVDLVAEELHLLQPAFARFYDSLNGDQQHAVDAAIQHRGGQW